MKARMVPPRELKDDLRATTYVGLYQVIVGNIGTVVNTNDHTEASRAFHEYVRQANTGYGRAAGESVVFMRGDEVISERPSDDELDDADAILGAEES